MTKTEACRRVALAALLAGGMAAAQDAHAGLNLNGSDLNGFAEEAASAQPSAGPVELTDRQMDGVTAEAGKVTMQDFHFVMRNNSSSPGLVRCPDKNNCYY
jgi:hypothetical protein